MGFVSAQPTESKSVQLRHDEQAAAWYRRFGAVSPPDQAFSLFNQVALYSAQ